MEYSRSIHLCRAVQHAFFGMMTCALVESTGGDELDRSELLQVMTDCYAVISRAGSMQSSPVTEEEARQRAKELLAKIRQVIDQGVDIGGDEGANQRDLQTARRSLQTAKDELALAVTSPFLT
jgi:hypothetical protein